MPAAIIPSVPLPVWGVIHAVGAFVMVWFGRYERFLAIIKWFIGLKFGAIIASALLIVLWSGADWSGAGARSEFSTAYTLSLIGGVGGTVTLLSYGYWMREAGWAGPERMKSARSDLTVSFSLVFVFCISMIFLATQIDWAGQILDEGPRLCLLLADRIGQEIGPIGRAVFLLGFWGAAFSSVLGVYHGVPFLFDDMVHLWRRQPAGGQRGDAVPIWAAYLALAAISALVIRRPVWLVFAYTVVGSLFFPFVISTLLWLNNSRHARATRNGPFVNVVLGGALALYAFLAVEAFLKQPLKADIAYDSIDLPSHCPRSRSRSQRSHGTRSDAGVGRSGPAGGAAGVRALLVRRTPRHGQHCELGAGDPDRARRIGDLAHSCRIGRHHAAESRTAARGGSLSHARDAASQPHRPGPGPCARHRPGDLTRAQAVRW